ncbi:hypothetical protein [Rhodohalobacter mucosus]|uniref:Uncharacterized protein n=1 Tax=Rhodohalobacter mucosus TaxID=2079485 RepID=A0A316TSV7_9BACT|nr:hypothetical protein [Rhodohalobacter mucosus]PWN06711.1 hypothetical protein DDZ15_09355 [Rhodohalobacter mucosus]
MLERIVENWLTNASERSFQLPFCYTLQNKNHRILHLTRHRPIEFGKDVITIDENDEYHAFQLKQGNITQRVFTELLPQLNQLCYLNLAHPHIHKDAIYTPYLVTNGKIDEEVYRQLEDLNSGLDKAKRPKLVLLQYDDLYTDFLELGANLWPSELSDYKKLIEFSILDGKENFSTNKFIDLLEHQLEINTDEVGEIKNKPSTKRNITSAALLTAFAVSNYIEEENHVAIIECWTIYIAQIVSIVNKLELNIDHFKEAIEIAKTIIHQSLSNLLEELEEREDLFEGNIIFDKPFYNYRATKVVGLVSLLHLWIIKTDNDDELLDRTSAIIENHQMVCRLNTEAHLPYFLAIYWALRKIDSTQKPVGFLKMMIETIINSSKNGEGLPNPYYREQELMSLEVQHILQTQVHPNMSLDINPLDDDFKYSSYYLLGLVHIFVRLNYKQLLKFLWPQITRFNFKHFEVSKSWHFFRWRNPGQGNEKSFLAKHTKSWKELRTESEDFEESFLPNFILSDPIFGILFLLFFPHRVSADYIKFLDTELRKKL